MDSIRNNTIKLAYENPEMREALLPLLKKEAGSVFTSEAKLFAGLLKKANWSDVRYDEDTNRGSARLGKTRIEFYESSNDPAVVVEVSTRVKGNARETLAALSGFVRASQAL